MNRKLSRFIILSSVISFTTLCAGQNDVAPNDHWTMSGDWIYMKRIHLSNKKLVNDTGASMNQGIDTGGKIDLETKNAIRKFDFEPGFKAALSYRGNQENMIQAVAWIPGDWRGSRSVKGPA